MFASNQILKLSGEFDELKSALVFALKKSNNYKNLEKSEKERGCKLVYQITKSGLYCIGWGFEVIPKGWKEYEGFDFDIDIVSMIIIQHLKNQDDHLIRANDGTYSKGFLMSKCSYDRDIENPFFGIVYFEPYTNFYAK